MKTVAGVIALIVAGLAASIATVSAFEWVQYARMTFNSEGRFFDPTEEAVYTTTGKDAWAFIAVSALLIGLVAAIFAIRLARTTRRV
jgi:hypothetical protein